MTCNGIMYPTVYTSCEDQRRQEPMSENLPGVRWVSSEPLFRRPRTADIVNAVATTIYCQLVVSQQRPQTPPEAIEMAATIICEVWLMAIGSGSWLARTFPNCVKSLPREPRQHQQHLDGHARRRKLNEPAFPDF